MDCHAQQGNSTYLRDTNNTGTEIYRVDGGGNGASWTSSSQELMVEVLLVYQRMVDLVVEVIVKVLPCRVDSSSGGSGGAYGNDGGGSETACGGGGGGGAGSNGVTNYGGVSAGIGGLGYDLTNFFSELGW